MLHLAPARSSAKGIVLITMYPAMYEEEEEEEEVAVVLERFSNYLPRRMPPFVLPLYYRLVWSLASPLYSVSFYLASETEML